MLKVAIIHYWLVGMRGGEKVLESLCEVFPQADLYTHVLDESIITKVIRNHKIFTTFIQKLPQAKSRYQKYLPLMPLALEQLDLRDYDLVISIESGPAKGVITSPETLHICYCCTPMRYVWDMYHDYLKSAGRITRLLMPLLIHYLRLWDYASAARVDYFLADSGHVAKRIQKHYRRDATILYPPVDLAAFTQSSAPEDFYLMVGQLVGYKRADLAVEAFNRLGKSLVIIGDGEQFNQLCAQAQPNIKIMGRQPFSVIRDHYSRCKALIFPGEEDFGIVPVEAMASGRPIIAYRKGGALETVVEGITGLFFDQQTPESLIQAIEQYEATDQQFNSERIIQHSQNFSQETFTTKIQQFVETALLKHKSCPYVSKKEVF
jgi:glycosyltransferase involved in cell wall biosynthesis